MGKPIMDTLIPAPKNDDDVAQQVPVEVEGLKINKEGLVAAAKDFGMTAFRPESLLAAHIFGTTFKQVGVLKIGRTMLYAGLEGARAGLEQCDQLLEEVKDPEVKASIIPAKASFSKQLIDGATQFIRSAELDGNDDSDNRNRIKPFGAGQMAGPLVIAQQAVVNTTQK